jgi:DNA repair exonuclease SbcCD ATPase subunit
MSRKQAPKNEYRRLENMIVDLKVIKSTLLGQQVDEKRLEEMKGFDDFQKKKMALNLFLGDLRKEIERLCEMKKNLGEEKDRDTNTIKLESANRKKLQEAMGMFNEVKKTLMADLKKHESGKSKLEEKDIEDRKQMVAVFAREIQELTKKNSRVKGVQGQASEEESELAKSRREARRQKKEEEKARRARRKKKGEPEEPAEEPQPMSAEEQEFMKQHDQNIKDQDELLDEISKGMDELKQIGLDMNKTLTIQNQMLEVIEEKVDINNEKLKNANKRLKDIMEQSGGMTVWCPRMICLVLLLGLLGYVFNLV